MIRSVHSLIAAAVVLATAGNVAAQVDCQVLGGGATIHADGTILVLGQFAIGTVGSGATALEQGAVPCWVAGPTCPGDATGDGVVDESDLGVVLANWRSNVAPGTLGDVTGDGFVDESDLGVLLTNFGAGCP